MNNNVPFDVFLLAGNIREAPLPTTQQNIYQIKKSCAATGYIVKSHYYDFWIENIETGIKLLMENPKEHYFYAIDIYWFHLQNKDDWKMIFPRTVTQRADYSDIEKYNVNYNHLMLDR